MFYLVPRRHEVLFAMSYNFLDQLDDELNRIIMLMIDKVIFWFLLAVILKQLIVVSLYHVPC